MSCLKVRFFVNWGIEIKIEQIPTWEHRILRVVTFGKLRKSALTEVLLFCANAPNNFLERELMERGVSGGYISIQGCQIRRKLALTELCETID